MKPYSFQKEEKEYINKYVQSFDGELTSSIWDTEDEGVKKIKIKIKQHYIFEQKHNCYYCKQRIVVKHSAAWDAEHVIPRKTHPSFCFEPENICIVCKDCNNAKNAEIILANPKAKRFPRESKNYTIVHPHFDTYDEHINVIEPGLLYRGKTDKGENSIRACNLKRFIYEKFLPECSSTDIAEKFITAANAITQSPKQTDQLLVLVAIKQAIEMEINSIIRDN